MSDSRRRNLWIRWLAPLAIIWLGVMLSGYVYADLIPNLTRLRGGQRILFFLLCVPVGSLVLLLILRYATRKNESEAAEAFVIWAITFLFAVHVVVLGVMARIIDSLATGVPLALALLFVGLGLVIRDLSYGSSLGIRLKTTLKSEAAWRSAHQSAGKVMLAAGIAQVATLAVPAAIRLQASIAVGAAALGVSLILAGRPVAAAGPETDEMPPKSEDLDAETRPHE